MESINDSVVSANTATWAKFQGGVNITYAEHVPNTWIDENDNGEMNRFVNLLSSIDHMFFLLE